MMKIDRLHGQYWFHDGSVQSFCLDIQNGSMELVMFVKRIERQSSTGPLQQEDLTPCRLSIQFERLIEVSLFDRFPTQGYFIDFSTFNRGDEGVEMHFIMHDRSSFVYEKPNWVIKARKVTWREV